MQPNWPLWRTQIMAIIGMEWKKTFFARRGLWVYILAFLPALLFMGHAYQVRTKRADMAQASAARPQAAAIATSIPIGAGVDEVKSLLNRENIPYSQRSRGRKTEFVRFSDGQADYALRFNDGKLASRDRREPAQLAEDIQVFAGVFQYFFLRLAIFFGCVGIFVNLFRGEMLDQSLHYYLLSPVRREILLIGKYCSGLLATTVIFTTSVAVQLFFLLSAHTEQSISNYLNGPGWGHIFAYLGVSILACVGYGSIFVASGLIFKNPLIPAVVLLFWEGSNWFLPEVLKKISVIFYLQSLCPVVAPFNGDIPEPLKILISTAAPIPAPVAIGGILLLAATVLALAAIRVRKIEINYSSD